MKSQLQTHLFLFLKLYGNPQLFLMHLLSTVTHFCALFCFASYLWDVSFVVVFSYLSLFETPVFMFYAFNQNVYLVLDCNVFWASPVGQGAIETLWIVYYFLRSLFAVGVWFGGILQWVFDLAEFCSGCLIWRNFAVGVWFGRIMPPGFSCF